MIELFAVAIALATQDASLVTNIPYTTYDVAVVQHLDKGAKSREEVELIVPSVWKFDEGAVPYRECGRFDNTAGCIRDKVIVKEKELPPTKRTQNKPKAGTRVAIVTPERGQLRDPQAGSLNCNRGPGYGDLPCPGTIGLLGGRTPPRGVYAVQGSGGSFNLNFDGESAMISGVTQLASHFGGPIIGTAVCTLLNTVAAHARDVREGYYWTFQDTMGNIFNTLIGCIPYIGPVLTALKDGNPRDAGFSLLGGLLGMFGARLPPIAQQAGHAAISLGQMAGTQSPSTPQRGNVQGKNKKNKNRH